MTRKWYDLPGHFNAAAKSAPTTAAVAVISAYTASKTGDSSFMFVPGGVTALFTAFTVANLRRDIINAVNTPDKKKNKDHLTQDPAP